MKFSRFKRSQFKGVITPVSYCLLSAILLLYGIIHFVNGYHQRGNLDVTLSDLRAANQEIESDGVAVESNYVDKGKEFAFLESPVMPLKAGSYTIQIHYKAAEAQKCKVIPRVQYERLWVEPTSEVTLSPKRNTETFEFLAKHDLQAFSFSIFYNGKGTFSVQSISIIRNLTHEKRELSLSVLACVLLFAGFQLYYLPLEKKETIIVLIGITLLNCLPLMTHGIYYGHDLNAHLPRIESIVNSLKEGIFPSRVTTVYNDGYGNAVDIYYGNILLYIPACFRLAGFSILESYKIYIAIIHCVTVFVSYIVFREFGASRKVGWIGTLVYSTSTYRFTNFMYRSAVGEYSSLAFVPLFILAFYRIVYKEQVKWNNILLLSISAAVIFCTHLPTTLMLGFLTGITCIILWKRIFRKRIFCALSFSILLFLLISAYFWVPFLDYYLTGNESIKNQYFDILVDYGVDPLHLFSFFRPLAGRGDKYTIMNHEQRMQLTTGPAIVMTLIFGCIYFYKIKNSVFKYFLITSCLTLLLATSLIPWQFLAEHCILFKVLAKIQFPWRFLGFTILLASILLVIILQSIPDNSKYKLSIIIVSLSLFSYSYDISDYSNNKVFFTPYQNTSEIEGEIYSEYIPYGTDLSQLNGKITGENVQNAVISERKITSMSISCETSDIVGTLTIPLINFKGYQVHDSRGIEYPIFNGINNQISIQLPSGFNDTLTIEFIPLFYWRIAEYVSLVTVIVCLIFTIPGKIAGFLRRERQDDL